VITPTEVLATWKQVCEFAPENLGAAAAQQPLYAAE
jgi:hypothetical protein